MNHSSQCLRRKNAENLTAPPKNFHGFPPTVPQFVVLFQCILQQWFSLCFFVSAFQIEPFPCISGSLASCDLLNPPGIVVFSWLFFCGLKPHESSRNSRTVEEHTVYTSYIRYNIYYTYILFIYMSYILDTLSNVPVGYIGTIKLHSTHCCDLRRSLHPGSVWHQA